MGAMMRNFELKESVTVNRSLEDAFRYLSHFENIQEWDPGVSWCRSVSLSAPAIGNIYQLGFIAGTKTIPMEYQICAFEPNKEIALKGSGEGIKASDTISFAARDHSCEIHYRAVIELSTSLPFSLMRPVLHIIGRRAVAGLKRTLSNQPPDGGKAIHRWEDGLIVPGMINFSVLGWHRSKSRFRGPMPSLVGRWVAITGATSGIGLSVAERLAASGANLLLVGRNAENLQLLLEDFKRRGASGELRIVNADLSRPDQLRNLIVKIREMKINLHALINNAGLLSDKMRWMEDFSVDESTFINLIAPYCLARGLTEILEPEKEPRIINVSSGGMYTKRLDIKALTSQPTSFSGGSVYAQAKRAMVVMTEEMMKPLLAKGIQVHAMHPGWVDTPGVRESLPRFYHVTKSILRTPEQGADTAYWLASVPTSQIKSGLFWLDRTPHGTYAMPGTKEDASARQSLMNFLDDSYQQLFSKNEYESVLNASMRSSEVK